MPKIIYPVRLNDQERAQLEQFLKQGKKSARATTRARIILLLDEQKTEEEIAEQLGVCRATVANIRKRYHKEGIESALKEKPRSGRPWKIDSRLEAKVTMLACSEPPEGQGQWTLRLIAERLVILQWIDSISYGTVYNILKKTN